MPQIIQPNAVFELTSSLRLTSHPYDYSTDLATHIAHCLDGLPLRLHLNRLLTSARAFKWPAAIAKLELPHAESNLCQRLWAHTEGVVTEGSTFKVRILVSEDGDIVVERDWTQTLKPPVYPFRFDVCPFMNAVDAQVLVCKVNLAKQPVETSLFTKHKTTRRAVYDDAQWTIMQYPVAPTKGEVLLHNTAGEVTEAVYSTVYFCRGEDWTTPAEACGGNLGTTRAWALEQGWCKERVICEKDVRAMDNQVVWLSNAVRGFWPALLCLDETKWHAHLTTAK